MKKNPKDVRCPRCEGSGRWGCGGFHAGCPENACYGQASTKCSLCEGKGSTTSAKAEEWDRKYPLGTERYLAK